MAANKRAYDDMTTARAYARGDITASSTAGAAACKYRANSGSIKRHHHRAASSGIAHGVAARACAWASA